MWGQRDDGDVSQGSEFAESLEGDLVQMRDAGSSYTARAARQRGGQGARAKAWATPGITYAHLTDVL